MSEAVGPFLPEFVLACHFCETVEQAAVPGTLSFARYEVPVYVILHVEAVAGRADEIAGAAAKTGLGFFFPDGMVVCPFEQFGQIGCLAFKFVIIKPFLVFSASIDL